MILYEKNSRGLPTVYNTAIDHAKDNPAILVFIHDDISLVDFYWVDRIYEAAARFDIAGVAGNTRRLPFQPGWAFVNTELKWDDQKYLSGVVGHGSGFPCWNVSTFGRSQRECKLLDGLMLIADSERLHSAGVRFDEQFKFHFYDMDFCRQAELKGLTMGTYPISVVHESGGAFGTPMWHKSYELYLQKYGS